MSTPASRTFATPSVAVRLMLCAAALAGVIAPVSDAKANVVTFSTPIAVPNNGSGVYINLLTGASVTGRNSMPPGFDIDLWSSSGFIAFGWGNFADPDSTAGRGVADVPDGDYLDLAAGSVISDDSSFARSTLALSAAAFRSTGTHTLGFQFFNEATNTYNFGYMTLLTTGPRGFPATITGWSFEDSGGAITVSAVPETGTAAMFSVGALALCALNLRRKRRRSPTAEPAPAP